MCLKRLQFKGTRDLAELKHIESYTIEGLHYSLLHIVLDILVWMCKYLPCPMHRCAKSTLVKLTLKPPGNKNIIKDSNLKTTSDIAKSQ